MGFYQVTIIHTIKLIARQNDHVFNFVLIEINKVFSYGVGGSLVPIAAGTQSFLCCQQLDEPTREMIKRISHSDMAVQADGHKLCQHIDPINLTVQAIGDGDIDQPVHSRQGNRWFAANRGERGKP